MYHQSVINNPITCKNMRKLKVVTHELKYGTFYK